MPLAQPSEGRRRFAPPVGGASSDGGLYVVHVHRKSTAGGLDRPVKPGEDSPN
jgi:hypothetical protein